MEELDLREYCSLNIRFIHALGYYFSYAEAHHTKRCIYRVYSCIVIGFVYVLSLSTQIAQMMLGFGDIEQMTQVLYSSFVLPQGVKFYCFMANEQKIRQLLESINRKEFKPNNVEQCTFLQNDINKSKLITKIFVFMCLCACCCWAVLPFFGKDENEGNKLPLSGRYPFDLDKSLTFELLLVYQIFTTACNGIGNISMDTFLSAMLMVISGQLTVLNNAFANLKQRGQNADDNLINCIRHYREILQFANEVMSLFSGPIAFQILLSVTILCMIMFQMSLVSPFSVEFLSMVIYKGCILLEIFLWCYYGNEVIIKSQKLTQSAYSCEWIEGSKKFKHNLLFFMTRSQVPLVLYAEGYFPLSLPTFVAIVKSAWSYFAVLNQVHSE